MNPKDELKPILSDQEARSIRIKVWYFFESLSYHPAGGWLKLGCLTVMAAKFAFVEFFERTPDLLVYGPWIWAMILLGIRGYDGRSGFNDALKLLDGYELTMLEQIAMKYPEVRAWIDDAKSRGGRPRRKDLLNAMGYEAIKRYKSM